MTLPNVKEFNRNREKITFPEKESRLLSEKASNLIQQSIFIKLKDLIKYLKKNNHILENSECQFDIFIFNLVVHVELLKCVLCGIT